MKVVLLARSLQKSSGNKNLKRVTRGGYGSTLLSEFIDGDKGKPVKRSSIKSIEPAIKINDKLSDVKLKAANDQELDKMLAYKAIIEETIRALVQQNDSPIFNIYDQLRKEYQKQEKAIAALYEEIHGTKPTIKKNSPDQLAKIYIEFVTEIGSKGPTQEELSGFSKISQATWSRAFRDVQFWKDANQKIENLWEVSSVVKDKIEHFENHTRSNKELSIDGMKHPDGSKKTYDDVTPKDYSFKENIDKIMAPAEQKRIDKLTKPKLIDELIKMKPTIKKAELEAFSDDLLRRTLITLTA